MPECRRKVRSALAFLPVVSCLSPASAFRPQGSVWYRWSRIIPALPSYVDGYLAALCWMSMTWSWSSPHRVVLCLDHHGVLPVALSSILIIIVLSPSRCPLSWSSLSSPHRSILIIIVLSPSHCPLSWSSWSSPHRVVLYLDHHGPLPISLSSILIIMVLSPSRCPLSWSSWSSPHRVVLYLDHHGPLPIALSSILIIMVLSPSRCPLSWSSWSSPCCDGIVQQRTMISSIAIDVTVMHFPCRPELLRPEFAKAL